jgi:hypothetical protein
MAGVMHPKNSGASIIWKWLSCNLGDWMTIMASAYQRRIIRQFAGGKPGYTRVADRGVMYLYRSLFIVVLIVVGAFAQSSSNPSTPDQKHTVRVGVAATENRSSRQIIPTWERDQLVRELQRLRINRNSEIVLEVVSLDATAREDASSEAEQKSCRYFVLTTLLNPSRGPAISGGPDGSQ